jgi:hypothetical protein
MSKHKKVAPSGQITEAQSREYVPTRMIAKEMNTTRQTVRRGLDAAGIAYVRMGTRRYYLRSDLDAFIASQRAKPGTAS